MVFQEFSQRIFTEIWTKEVLRMGWLERKITIVNVLETEKVDSLLF